MTKGNRSVLTAGILIILMLITSIGAILKWPDPSPTIDIIYGEEMESSPSSELTMVPLTPSMLITIANITSFDYWSKHEHAGHYVISSDFSIPILKVTQVALEFSFSVTADNTDVQMELQGWHYSDSIVNSSTLQAGNHCLNLILPWDGSNYTKNDWVDQVRISFSVSDGQKNATQLRRFVVQVAVSESVAPLTVDIRRTNGESLFSNPLVGYMDWYLGPEMVLTSSDSFTEFRPTHNNETILIPAGNISATFEWRYGEDRYLLMQNYTVQANHSVMLRFNCQFVRVNIECSQRLPQLNVLMATADDHIPTNCLAYASPFFFVAPNSSFCVGVWSSISPHGCFASPIHIWSLSSLVQSGSNRNITFIIDPNFYEVSSVIIDPWKLISILSFALMLLIAPVYFRSRKMGGRFLLSWTLLALSLFFPWLSTTDWISSFHSILKEPRIIYWVGSPSYSTIMYCSDSNVVLMAQRGADFAISVVLWTIVFAMLLERTFGQRSKNVSEARELAMTIAIMGFCLIEFVYLYYLLGTYGSVGLKLEIGPFLSLLAVVLWLLLPRIARGFDNSKLLIQSTKTMDD